MQDDGDEVLTVLAHIVSKLVNGTWSAKLNIFISVLVKLFFGKFYSSIKNDKDEESVLLVNSMRQLLQDSTV